VGVFAIQRAKKHGINAAEQNESFWFVCTMAISPELSKVEAGIPPFFLSGASAAAGVGFRKKSHKIKGYLYEKR
jgi:hypothetical protein